MTISTANRRSRVYQTAVTVIGTAAWAASVVLILSRDSLPDQLTIFALVPLLLVVSRFVHIFRLPSGLKFSDERLSFSFSDAIVLLVACWHGPLPALLLAGI